jgi:hypothetical protein
MNDFIGYPVPVRGANLPVSYLTAFDGANYFAGYLIPVQEINLSLGYPATFDVANYFAGCPRGVDLNSCMDYTVPCKQVTDIAAQVWMLNNVAQAWVIESLAQARVINNVAQAWVIESLAQAWVINNVAQAWVIESLAQVWVMAAQSSVIENLTCKWVNQGQKPVAIYQWVVNPMNNSVFSLVGCASQFEFGSINHCGSHPVTTKWIILRDESQAQFWTTPTAEYVSYTSAWSISEGDDCQDFFDAVKLGSFKVPFSNPC